MPMTRLPSTIHVDRFVSINVQIVMLSAVCGLLGSGIAFGEAIHSSAILVSDGDPPFGIGNAGTCLEPTLVRPESDSVFLQALDRTHDAQNILGVSRDELYQVDGLTGASQLIGRIGHSAGTRFWFAACNENTQSFQYGEPGTAGSILWYLRATITQYGTVGGVGEFEIERSGVILDGTQLGVLLDEEFSSPQQGDVYAQITLALTADGLIDLEVQSLGPSSSFDMEGVFVAMTPNEPAAQPLSLPVTGLTIANDGTIMVLSDAYSDPFGEAALYELDTSGGVVTAYYVSTPDVQDIQAIEFTNVGQLFAAGDNLYLIDPTFGISGLLLDLAGNTAIELDYNEEGRLHAMARGSMGSSMLLDVTPGDVANVPVAQYGSKSYWGLVSTAYDAADLDLDGDVDVDDQNLFDAAFTGSTSAPSLPAGIPEPESTTLIAPSLPSEGSHYFFEAATGSNGTIVEGTPPAVNDSSARISISHNASTLYVTVQVVDDHRSDQSGGDFVELYFDTNNSDSSQREGDENGFQASLDYNGIVSGDAGALHVWEADAQGSYRPGPRIHFSIDKSAANMVTGGSYGFDVAIQDTDDPPVDPAKYYLFSSDANGDSDESQWGNVFLAPGPVPPQADAPSPPSSATGLDTDIVLSWVSPDSATQHHMYLGAQPTEMIYLGPTQSNSHQLDMLSPNATYYWRVDEANSNGINRGRVWSFSTEGNLADIDGDGDVDEHDARRLFQRPPGDATGDGIVDESDYVLVLAAIGATEGELEYDPEVDYDSDGIITANDWGIWQCHSINSGNAPVGDFDGDGDVDAEDFIPFIDCLQGPSSNVEPPCLPADLISDNHVDLRDVAIFQQLFGAMQD
ncbi:MAG: hypothetical protein DHS20C16_05050 [Phycisphaerae bacterium]|nr:MAG: hypothetical protein DHS20C16_05050 [Phycisphaerae bacterium]